MEQRVLVLCDPEEDYAQRMADFMRRDKFFPWRVKVYTHVDQLQECVGLHSRDMLVIAESVYQEDVLKLGAGKTVILNETGIVREEKLNNVSKYQKAEVVVQQLKELGDLEEAFLEEGMETKLIGLYSPIRRSLQTSFGLCLGKLLSQRGRTLYLSFEAYSGVEGLPGCDGVDLSTLLYLLTDEKKFRAGARRQIRREENFEYVCSMVNPQNLLMVGVGEWRKLLYHLQKSFGYEYIILDLSESVQGLFDILRMCTRVYCMAKDNPIAKRKLDQYEQLLSLMEYGDVREKTSICRLPLFRNIPTTVMAAAKGDLADYVRKLVEKEEWY